MSSLKKLLCILLTLICIFCFCIVNPLSASAAFVIDDALIAAFIASLAASIVIATGWGVITDNPSVYENFANQMARDLSLAVDDFRYTIINGKAYFSVDGDTWNSILNYINNYDFENAHIMANIVSDTNTMLPNSSGYTLSDISGFYSIGLASQVVSYSSATYSAVYLPTGEFSVTLSNDGTVFKPRNTFDFTDKIVVVTAPNTSGTIRCLPGLNNRGQITNNINNVTQINTTSGGYSLGYGSSIYVHGSNVGHLLYYSQSNNIWTYKLDSTTICQTSLLPAYYWDACLFAGALLCNIPNNVTSVNTTADTDVVDIPVEVEAIPPLFNEPIDDQLFVNVPVLGDMVIPGTDTVLTPEQVKDRVRDDESVELVPNFPQYINNNLGAPVYVTSNPVIPNDADVPLYVPGYPDVINPAYPDISVTANADVFPSVTAGNNESVTSGENESVTAGENVSQVVSEAVSDLTDQLSADDVQRGLNRMKLPQMLIRKFPFCIPFDFYNSVAVLYADAEPIHFSIPIKNTRLGIDESIDVDLSQYENLAKIVRWFFSISWVAGLVLLTRKVVWK